MIPVVSLDSQPQMYVVYDHKDITGISVSSIQIQTITGTPAGGDVNVSQTGLPIMRTQSPPDADQPGSPSGSVQMIDPGDDAIQSAVVHNGTLWASGGDDCMPGSDTAARACLRLLQVSLGGPAPTVVTDTDIGDSGGYLYYPAVMMDRSLNMYLTFSESSAIDYASAQVLATPAGQTPAATGDAVLILGRGNQAYADGEGLGKDARWGDYSGIAADPTDVNDVWAAGEFGADSAAPQWDTAIARVTLAPPTITSVTPASGPASPSPCNTVVTLTGDDFSPSTTVTFGGMPAAISSVQPDTIMVTAPPEAAGVVQVDVHTQQGDALTNYIYVADTTPPTTSAPVSPAPNTAGWNKSNPTVSLNATDETCGSGVASITYSAAPTSPTSGGQTIAPTTVAGSTASFPITVEGQTTITYTAKDNAGNVTPAKTLVVKLDRTPPVAAIAASRPADHNGWYNHPVTATATGTDSPAGIASGIATCTVTPASGPSANPYNYSAPDTTGATLIATCTDVASNVSAPAPLAFKYDATPPANVTGSASRPPDFNGWYNHLLQITFTGTDTTSGIASCTSNGYNGPDNKAIVYTGNCTDNAGNYTLANFGPFNYDHTPPSTTVSGGLLQVLAAGAPVTGGATDNVSGVLVVGVAFVPLVGPAISRTAICTACGTTTATWRVSTTGIPTGVYTVYAQSIDEAGNTSAASNTIIATIVG